MQSEGKSRSTGRIRLVKGKAPTSEQALARRLQKISLMGARVQRSYTPSNASRLNKDVRGSNPQAQVAAAYASAQRSALPVLSSSQNSCRVVHRELIASISGSQTFVVQNAFPLNPGMPLTFPWLSVIAQQWEQYRFNSLRFCYYTRTGSNTVGSLQLIPDYDAADSAPLSEQAASAYEDVVEDAPWKDISCILKPSALHPMGPRKYIRTGALAANLDIKTYDSGTLFVAAIDGASGSPAWGKLWVEYDVTFSVPQLASGGLSTFAHLTSSTPVTGYILPNPTIVSGSLPISVVANSLVFPAAGSYFVSYTVYASTSATASSAPAVAGGASLDSNFGFGSGFTEAGSGTTILTQNLLVITTGPSQSVIFDNTLVSGTQSELVVSELPSGAV